MIYSEADVVMKLLQVPPHPVCVLVKGDHFVANAQCHSARELLDYVSRIGLKDVGIYVALNPSRLTQYKPSKQDILRVRWMAFDLDPMPEVIGADPTLAVFRLKACLSQLQRGPAGYTLAIDSGRGLQVWCRLGGGAVGGTDEADTLVKALTAHVKQATLAGLAECGYNLDTSCGEISRVVRLPGSINRRTGRYARFMYGIPGDPDLPTEELAWDAVRPLALRGAPGHPQDLPPLGSGTLLHIAPRVTPTARHFLLFGTDTSGDSRHKDCFTTAKCLQEIGVEAEQAYNLLALGASRCLPPLPDADWRRIHRQVFDGRRADS